MAEENDLLSVLKRIECLLAALVRVRLADRIGELRANPKERALYDHVGELSQSELAKKAGVTQPTVSKTLQKWEAEGLLVKDRTQYRRLF